MFLDVKLESDKIASELISGSVEQACEDYKNILGNYSFLTSASIEKSVLNNLGSHLAKQARKKPSNFLLFCKKLWNDTLNDGKDPVGSIMAALAQIEPEEIIPEIVEMCRNASDVEEVDILVTAFEQVILREPQNYFSMLEKHILDKNIWVKRLVIMTTGHIMYRHKSYEITMRCLELIRRELSNENECISKATSWIIGTYGLRADQMAVAAFINSFDASEKPVVVRNFTEAFKRSKIALQRDVCDVIIPTFEKWSKSSQPEICKNAQNALKHLKKKVYF